MNRFVRGSVSLLLNTRRCFHVLVLTVLLLGALQPARPVHAAIAAVYVTKDSLDSDFLKNANVCTLREAVRSINEHYSYDGCKVDASTKEIVLPAGTFMLTREGKNDDVAWIGDLDIRTDMIITGAGAAYTTIGADDNESYFGDRIFHIGPPNSGGPYNVTIKNLKIIGGFAQDSHYGGGGILNEWGNLTLSGVVFENNKVAAGLVGGGVANLASSTLTVDNATFDNNSADFGGAIYNQNRATITNSLIINNTAQLGGGGLDNDPWDRVNGFMKLTNVTIANNTASANYGAGINNSGKFEASSLTIAHNFGIGLFLNGDTISPYNATLRGSIIAKQNSDALDCKMQNASTKFSTGGYNLIGSTINPDPTSIYLCQFNTNGITTDLTDVDPMLADEPAPNQNSSTKVFDFTSELSPAVDAIPQGNAACLPKDQLFHNRPVDGNKDGGVGCDIGAFELGGTMPKLYLPMALK